MAHHLKSPVFWYCGGCEIRVTCFILSKIYFQLIFNQENLENTIGILLNQPITSKSTKNHFKIQNQPEIKNHSELTSVSLSTFKVKKKKKPNLSYPYHMEPFEIKIYHFGSWNRRNNNSLSKLKSKDPLSPPI